MIQKLQKTFALSHQGAVDLIKGCIACMFQNLSFLFPVGLLYFLVGDLFSGGIPAGKIWFYVIGCGVAAAISAGAGVPTNVIGTHFFLLFS